MYNRYIPGNNGIYQRQVVEDSSMPEQPCPAPPQPCEEPPEACHPPSGGQSQGMLAGIDLGDVLLLCVILLLLLDADQDDMLSLLIMAVAFILFQ